MTLLIQLDNVGAGLAGSVDTLDAQGCLYLISKQDMNLGYGTAVGNQQIVTYFGGAPAPGPPQRLHDMISFAANFVIVPAKDDFYLNDGTWIVSVGGTALEPNDPPMNPTSACLVIYDTSQLQGAGYCVARDGTGGVLNLPSSNALILYHELSHAWRIVTNSSLALTGVCDPSSPEENLAIIEENDLRTQIAAMNGVPAELRDPGNHCGQACFTPPPPPPCCCCIIASVATGSANSAVVQELRQLRDGFIRATEVGFAFFDKLFFDYYDFSPQVCTLMASDQQLPPVARDSFVLPLLKMLRTFRAHLCDGLEGERLGRFFFEQVGDPEQRRESLAAVELGRRFWLGQNVPDDDIAIRLAALLRQRAWPSEHVRWALVEPVRIYGDLLDLAQGGGDAATVGRRIFEHADQWASELPLDHVWASLPAAELAREWAILESVLLRTEESRARFRRRLGERFGTIGPIRRLVESGPAGANP